MDGVRQSRNEIANSSIFGKVVQAGWIQTLNIAAPPPPAPPPWQVPAAAPWFVNRVGETRRVLDLFDQQQTGPGAGPVIVAVCGPPGVGKTEFGNRVAALAGDRFPDGQIYVPCAVYRKAGGSLDLGGVYRFMLISLGMAEEAIPAGEQECAAAYRTLTRGRRILVVLDDVELELQVRALAPSAPGAVLAISRRRLDGLRGGQVLALAIEPLGTVDGAAMIAEHIGAGRAQAESEQVAALVDLCGGLPVALRAVCAGLVRRSRRSLAETVAELRDATARVHRFEYAGVFAVFDDAYRELSPAAAELYRALGGMPGPDTTAEALAAATCLSLDEVEDGLDDLLGLCLLEERGSGRFAVHSLVALHAARTAGQVDSEPVRVSRLHRIIGWYLRCGHAADLAVAPSRMRLPGEESAGPPDAGPCGRVPDFIDDAEALGWLETEHRSLLGCVRAAAEQGWYETAWLLCDPLWALYQNHKHYADWIEIFRVAVKAAETAGAATVAVSEESDRAVTDWVRSRLLCLLSRAYIETEAFDEAFTCLGPALELARRTGDRRLEASVREFIGIVHLESGDPIHALAVFDAALDVRRTHEDGGDSTRGALILRYLAGRAVLVAKHPGLAVGIFEDAVVLARQIDPLRADPRLAWRIEVALAEALLESGEPIRAGELAAAAVQEAGRREVPLEQVRALDLVADCLAAVGQGSRAEECRATARQIQQAMQGSRTADS
jgi:tetratricopeptide (TPR) repeat protein